MKSRQEKQVSPLPIGRYWLDIAGQDLINDWIEWKTDMGKSVQVESNEEQEIDGVNHLFTIFKVKDNGAFFQADRFGFPNTAPASIKSSQDVLGAPSDEGDPTTEALQFLKTAGKVAAGLFIAKLAIDLIRKN